MNNLEGKLSVSLLCCEMAMRTTAKPSTKEERERLNGEGDKIKSVDSRFEKDKV